jgi:pimeloyl-ACP methyl ester carboxylesterase
LGLHRHAEGAGKIDVPFSLKLLLAICVIVAALGTLSAGITVAGSSSIARRHPPAGWFVDVKGGRLHVLNLSPIERAEDVPVVLLHGASGNLEDMRLGLGDALSRRHRVILVDRPGHGWSERARDGDGASPARQAAMIREMLDYFGIRRAVIVGHSVAGAVATALALDAPSHVAGLVLIAPVLHPWSSGIAWYYTLTSTPVIGPLFAHTLALPGGLALLDPAVAEVFAPQEVPADYAQRAAIKLVLRPESFIANAQDVAGLRDFVAGQARRYPELKMPITIIAGDRDSIVSARIHSRALADTLPHSKLIMLEGVGHMPHHVARDRIIEAIEEVVKQAGGMR